MADLTLHDIIVLALLLVGIAVIYYVIKPGRYLSLPSETAPIEQQEYFHGVIFAAVILIIITTGDTILKKLGADEVISKITKA